MSNILTLHLYWKIRPEHLRSQLRYMIWTFWRLTLWSCRLEGWTPGRTGTGRGRGRWGVQHWRWPSGHTCSWRWACQRSGGGTTRCTGTERWRSKQLRSPRAAWCLQTEKQGYEVREQWINNLISPNRSTILTPLKHIVRCQVHCYMREMQVKIKLSRIT